ncbi:MAG: hypothetical protein RLZZ417_2860 [Bacteroidota bacterium]
MAHLANKLSLHIRSEKEYDVLNHIGTRQNGIKQVQTPF